MWKLFLFFILSLMFSNFVTFQYTGAMIDNQLSQINSVLISEEANLSQQLKNLTAIINQTNLNIQNQNKTMNSTQQQLITNFNPAFQDLSSIVTDLSTLNNFWPYANVTTCDNINQIETAIVFKINFFQSVQEKVWCNLTRLTTQYNWISYNAFFAYSTILNNFNNAQYYKIK
ncbi:hypothetical protein PVAND_015109 [Polypedilum vanderplanki]|uniref:Uncharacterized protein n=1 Tax=Polypedilum vanderplanki TaxID=319348 RepID=A0A9J6BBZ8_POLVA|nr:hypothetical protein PVAND_015109 [Polypedilum vanderplanki]